MVRKMDSEARLRLKAELAKRGLKANAVSVDSGHTATYVSRIITGAIKQPTSTSLLKVCQVIGVDLTYILTGEHLSSERENLLADLTLIPDDRLSEIAEFVRENGLKPSGK
jgi:transcriptional regulator with XRE-family HTH domain